MWYKIQQGIHLFYKILFCCTGLSLTFSCNILFIVGAKSSKSCKLLTISCADESLSCNTWRSGKLWKNNSFTKRIFTRISQGSQRVKARVGFRVCRIRVLVLLIWKLRSNLYSPGTSCRFFSNVPIMIFQSSGIFSGRFSWKCLVMLCNVSSAPFLWSFTVFLSWKTLNHRLSKRD